MLRLSICDDEARCRERVAALVAEYGRARGCALSAECFSGAAQLLDSGGRFDIYLLDILMPGLSDMDLASELRQTDETADIVFLTSSPEFALEGYAVRPLDYLLKPVDRDRLFAARVRELTGRELRVSDVFPPVPVARGRFSQVKEAYLAYMTSQMDRGEKT